MLALLAGCTLTSGRKSSGKALTGKSSAGQVDYSESAVKARTESQAHYLDAILQEQSDEFESAADSYYRAALADPSNEPLIIEATSRLLRLRQSEKPDEKTARLNERIVELLKKATSYPNASGVLFARLGLAYSMIGKKDLAIEANRQAIKRMPGLLSGYQYLAQIHLQGGQAEEGLKVLDEAARQQGVDSAFLIDLAETYIAFGRAGSMDTIRARATEAFKRASTFRTTNPVQLQRLADGFNALGETDLALAAYQQLLERLPNLTAIRDKLVELYLRKQDSTNAAIHLRAIVRESPSDAKSHYLLGSILFEDKHPEEAAESFRRTILINPNFEPAYHDLAAALMNAEKSTEALETLEKARGKFQQNFVCEFYSALAFSRLKDYANSLKHFTTAEVIARATATNRLNHTFYFQLGAAYERNQKFKEAETYFRKALEASPDFAEALNYLGYMWAERGENLQEALAMIEKAVKFEPKNAAFLDSLGWVLFKLNKPEEALPHMLKSIEFNDEPDATLYDHLGDIYAALKKPAKAREAWQKSISIEPSDKVRGKIQSTDSTATPAPRSATR